MLKKLFYILPKPLRYLTIKLIELVGLLYINNKIIKICTKTNTPSNKLNILIYHISALSFGGTEKNLQMIAKHLDKDKYNVFVMHGTKTNRNRLSYLEKSNVNIIKFEYEKVDQKWPYFVKNMKPRLEDVINQNKIDCIITATPGQTTYPIINIKNIPIILINIFGSFSTQNSIRKHICISDEVRKLAERVIDEEKLVVQYIPSEQPLINDEKAKQIRLRFGIKDTELVFGRIGRDDDSIFDPIGILAFEVAIKNNPNIHYIIMSPANKAKQLVEEREIPNVHWLEPSFLEEDVWAFHHAIDVLAHFRMDGESCGLNIIESMLVGNPILSHRSHIWNAHLEYLDDSFSLVSEKDDYEQYAKNMNVFINLYKNGKLQNLGENAKKKSERLFLIENIIGRYESWINEAIK